MPKRIKDVENAMCSFSELNPGQRGETVGSVVSGESSPITFSPVNGQCTAEMRKSSTSSLNSSLRDRNGKNSLAQVYIRCL